MVVIKKRNPPNKNLNCRFRKPFVIICPESWDGIRGSVWFKKQTGWEDGHAQNLLDVFNLWKWWRVRSDWIFVAVGRLSLRIQSPCQMMIGVYNHILRKVFWFHYHSQKVIGSLGFDFETKHPPFGVNVFNFFRFFHVDVPLSSPSRRRFLTWGSKRFGFTVFHPRKHLWNILSVVKSLKRSHEPTWTSNREGKWDPRLFEGNLGWWGKTPRHPPPCQCSLQKWLKDKDLNEKNGAEHFPPLKLTAK